MARGFGNWAGNSTVFGPTKPAYSFTPRSARESTMSSDLRDFLMLPYGELEELNLKAKQQRKDRVPMDKLQEERIKYLSGEKRIKAVTLLFSDLEGRLHMLDYDK